ncbi:MAG: tagatose 1,6-diphosphate aldolase [Burkholderiaceae bacterium]
MRANQSLGKNWGLRRLATDDGHFTMVAVDQRPPIANLIAARRGIDADRVSFADMADVKRVIVDAVGAQASAMLLDPNFAIPAALPRMSSRTGLLLTLEDHRFESTPGGRLSHAIANWSVEKIRRCGGDGVKVLAWYRPDADASVIAHQKAFVETIGVQCREHQIPYVLELLVYPMSAESGRGADYVEDPGKLPELVLESVREFADPRYGVDLFKLESPVNGATLPAPDGSAAHREAQAWFDQMGAICRDAGVPWVMLSAGVTAAQFLRVMTYAYAAGANGFLAGRAIWLQAMQAFPDLAACTEQLREQGGGTLRELGEMTRRLGRAWQPDYGALAEISAEGQLCAGVR